MFSVNIVRLPLNPLIELLLGFGLASFLSVGG
jgi:hypothetical protein